MKTPTHCWSCGAAYPERSRRGVARRCLRCGDSEDQDARAAGAALLLRGGPEVLLICRDATASHDAGLWCLPGGLIRFNEDIREAVRREVREKTGLQVELGRPFDTYSCFILDRLVVSTVFPAWRKPPGAEPRPGPRVERVSWFRFDQLPELAYESDRRLLEALARDPSALPPESPAAPVEGPAPEVDLARLAELESRLERQSRRYDELMDLYMQELMRGAWINDLLIKVATTNDVAEIASQTTQHLMTQTDLGLTRIWLPGPADLCETCPYAAGCPQTQCLHLANERGDPDFGGPASAERIPPLPGTPAGDAALREDALQLEVERPNAQPTRFEGFPLDLGLELPGVLGIYAQNAREPGERRIFQFVARAIGAQIKNARLHQELKRSDQVKRIFIDKMSNELKTPLTVILGYAELLKEDRESAEDAYGQEMAAAIEKSGRDLYTLVESILFITKLESGRLAPKQKRCDLSEIVHTVFASLAAEVEAKGLTVELQGDPAIAWADPKWVERVCAELVANAIKFTEAGGVSVTLTADPEVVIVTVHDTGIGLAKTNRTRIFEPFTQGTRVEDDYQTNLHYGGLGVGLAIARTLVEQSGGQLWVESSIGSGSRFYFTLPRLGS